MSDNNTRNSVDNLSIFADNKNILNVGGKNNGSEDTELLDKGTVSTDDRGYDPLWQQSESAQKIQGYLGIIRGGQTSNENALRTPDSRWLAPNSYQQQIEEGPNVGILRTIRGVSLSGKDTIGRTLSSDNISKLKDTVFKDELGNIIPLYHWTPNVFTEFKYGDIGYHAGTVESAYERYNMLKSENAEKGIDTPTGIYKECYYNIKNPIFIPDAGQWTAQTVAFYLARKGLIPELQYERLSITEGFYDWKYDNPAAIAVREILSDLGYDGIIYYNQSEDVSSISAVALYPDQIIMVTDNGVPVEVNSVDTVDNESKQRQNVQRSLSYESDEIAPLADHLTPLNKMYYDSTEDIGPVETVAELQSGIDTEVPETTTRKPIDPGVVEFDEDIAPVKGVDAFVAFILFKLQSCIKY